MEEDIRAEIAAVKTSIERAIGQLERHARVNPTTAATVETVIEAEMRGSVHRLARLIGEPDA